MIPKGFNKTILLVFESGKEAFERDGISPSTANIIIEVMEIKDDDVIPEQMTRGEAAANPNKNFSIFKNYLLTGCVTDMML